MVDVKNEHIAFFIVTVIALIGIGIGIHNSQNIGTQAGWHVHEEPLATEDDIKQVHKSITTVTTAVLENVKEIAREQDARKETDSKHQEEILKNQNSIKDNHPTSPGFQGSLPPPDPTMGDDPVLSISTDKTEYPQGDTITFTGQGTPGTPVFLSIVTSSPARVIDLVGIPDSLGHWITDHQTEFDDPLGTWTVRAQQKAQTTDSLRFKIIEG